VSIVFIVALMRAESLPDTLQFALILVVAAIPAALPAVLTVTLAVGAVALAKKEAIVSRLSAIEELAGMDILCSDKTGTITKNAISIGGVETFPGITEADVIAAAAFASREESDDPIDKAVLARYAQQPAGSGTVTAFVPFDPVSKLSRATVKGADGRLSEVAKGAPQAIAALAGTGGERAGRARRVGRRGLHKKGSVLSGLPGPARTGNGNTSGSSASSTRRVKTRRPRSPRQKNSAWA